MKYIVGFLTAAVVLALMPLAVGIFVCVVIGDAAIEVCETLGDLGGGIMSALGKDEQE